MKKLEIKLTCCPNDATGRCDIWACTMVVIVAKGGHDLLVEVVVVALIVAVAYLIDIQPINTIKSGQYQ